MLDGKIVGDLQRLGGARVDLDVRVVDLSVVTARILEGVAHIAGRRIVTVTETGGENEDFWVAHGDES